MSELKTTNAVPFVRQLHEGMGQAVAERTILRKLSTSDGRVISNQEANELSWRWETWVEVAERVALGNSLLDPDVQRGKTEYEKLKQHIANASVLMSGRHLQHGDAAQPSRHMEVMTNCSTAASSFTLFMLLLCGSGVGRCYDDDMMLIDWDNAPTIRCVLDSNHPDFDWSAHESVRDAQHKYTGGTSSKVKVGQLPESFGELWEYGRDVLWYTVMDSREGWAKALEVWENAAFEKIHKDKMLILDFSKVRSKGTPIGGMQNRPASGPVPLMNAFAKANTLKGAKLPLWKQAMYLDHYFAECVLVGGARRAARMSTKYWRDPGILDFILIKRPIEYLNKSPEEITAYRKTANPFGFLWSSNNSIMVDQDFWNLLDIKKNQKQYMDEDAQHARRVFRTATEASYFDGTGEPAFINAHKLVRNDAGLDDYVKGDYVGYEKYPLNDDTQLLMKRLARNARRKKYSMIVNPCLTGDTWIQTSTGPQQVSDLVDNPFQALVHGQAYAATGFWLSGVKPVVSVETDRGYTAKLTPDHKMLVERGTRKRPCQVWIKAGDLKSGDRLVMMNHRPVEVEINADEFDHGWILGQMVGDGGYNPSKYAGYVRYWGNDRRAMAELALGKIRKFGLVWSPVPLGVSENSCNETAEVGTCTLDQMAEGYIEPCSKNILPALEKSPMSMVAGFLRGFFDADGCVVGTVVNGRTIRLSQSDISKLTIVQRMLARLGIVSTIYENRHLAGIKNLPDGKGGMRSYPVKANHELVISSDNLIRFSELIGFHDPLKAKKLQDTLASFEIGPRAERFVAKVKTVKDAGVEKVYDCTVDVVHRFDANGLVVANCGEIPLSLLGGYCTIGDVVPYHCETLDEAEEAFRVTTRALIRVNSMKCLYHKEVKRTNRIGVSITGIHEFAWKFFKLGFRDLIDEVKSKEFWLALSRFHKAVREESVSYSAAMGFVAPHTALTLKPAGTTSKLFGLTEGWHLPSMAWYLRWVQFRNDDPLVKVYSEKGYPVRMLKSYEGTTIIGFPTAPIITTLGIGDKLVTAAEASPEEQYRWVALGEKYWLCGFDGNDYPKPDISSQISYTLKYHPEKVDFANFRTMLKEHQRNIKCCSVMPQEDVSSYEYTPEQSITKIEYEKIMRGIKELLREDVDKVHVDCAGGVCPVDFRK